jgi:hypothetical protein
LTKIYSKFIMDKNVKELLEEEFKIIEKEVDFEKD